MIDPRSLTILVVLGCLVLFSLVPAVLIYQLFGSLSSADVSWADDKVKLGGPIAGFFATLLALGGFYFQATGRPAGEKKLSKPFTGRWRIVSRSNQTNRETRSDVTSEPDENGRLRFSGNVCDKTGAKVIGTWATDQVFCTPTSLAFRYTFIEKASAGTKTTSGFCSLFVEKSKKGQFVTLKGSWDLIGEQHQGGTITFERVDA